MVLEAPIGTADENDWEKIQELFEAALEQPEDLRTQFLDESGIAADLRSEVEELLSAFAAGESELERAPYEFSLNSQTTIPTGPVVPPEGLDGYQLLGEIHRGGQGVVYRALQESTKREVAIKFIHAGMDSNPAVKRRFEREVELAGSLRHPGIVRVYDSGLASGQYYYVMDFLEGDHLDTYVPRQKLSTEQILNLFIPICDAVNHAHHRGVIHRDIKPSNIIVDRQGDPHLVDFGLAKLQEALHGDTLRVSFTGQVMGTVKYMSPEQASGHPDLIDTRSDVYSLAVVLYQLLSGRHPYALGGALASDLAAIQTAEPAPIGGVDRDLETIALKALSKDPDRRYQTARELGEDIKRFLNGEPIEAKRDSVLYVLRKAAAKHRLVTFLSVACVLLVVTSTVVGWGLYLDAEEARSAESIAADRFEQERDTARQLRDESQLQRYFVEMNYAARLLNDTGGFSRVQDIVKRWQADTDFGEEQRGWEWSYLKSRINRHVHELRVESPPYCARFSPDGRWIAFGDESGAVQICLTENMSDRTEVLRHDGVVRSAAWSTDGRFLASGATDKRVQVFDVQNKSTLRVFSHEEHVVAVAWHPVRPLLASSSNDGVVRIWNMDSEHPEFEFDIGTGAQSLDWTRDGNRLIVGTWKRMARVWDMRQNKLVDDFADYRAVLNAARWNPDGPYIAAGEDNGAVSVFNVRKRSFIWKQSTGHTVLDLVWSPDFKSFATVGADRTVRVWDRRAPTILRKIDGHADAIWGIDWSADGQRLVTASYDRTIKVWNARDSRDDRTLLVRNANPIKSIAWSPDDSRIAVASELESVSLFDADGNLVQELDAGYGARLQTVSWSPDGTRLASGGWDEKSVIWDSRTGEKVTEFDHSTSTLEKITPNVVHRVVWSPDGRRVASCGHQSMIVVWDPGSGQPIHNFAAKRTIIYSIDWHPTRSNTLAASTSVRGAWIWAVGEKEPVIVETGNAQARCIRWSPDGRQFAICRDNGIVTIHSSESNEVTVSLKDHLGQVFAVDWHPNGQRLATASEDGTVRIWDAASGTQTMSFDTFSGPVEAVAWSRNGHCLAAGGQSGIVRIFDATVGSETRNESKDVPHTHTHDAP